MTTTAPTHLITGRGSRIRHIARDGQALCPSRANKEATGRFANLTVCARCQNIEQEEQQTQQAAPEREPQGPTGQPTPDDAPGTDAQPAAPLPVVASGEVVVHFSARVAAFMATEVVDAALAGALASPRLERCGRGYTAFVTTSRERAEALLGQMKELLFALESGARTKGRKGGMNFQPEAVIKGIEHITADLTTD